MSWLRWQSWRPSPPCCCFWYWFFLISIENYICCCIWWRKNSWLSVGALQVVLFATNTSSQSRVRYQNPDTKKQKPKTFIHECGFWRNPMFLFPKKHCFLKAKEKRKKQKKCFWVLPFCLGLSLIVASKFLFFSMWSLFLGVIWLKKALWRCI